MARKKNVRIKNDFKDNSIVKVTWTSPNDKKLNTLSLGMSATGDFKIRDRH